MTTTNKNPVLRGNVSQEGFLIHQSVPVANGTSAIHEGDLVYWDSSAGLAKAADTDAHCATLLGVALKASILNSNLDNTASVSEPDITVGYGVIANFKSTASESYAHGTAVYLGADAQTVTNASGNSHSVGVVQLPRLGATITGATGVNVPVLVYSRAFVTLAL